MANTLTRSKASLIVLILLFSVPVFSQTPGPQQEPSTQSPTVSEPDLINPDRPGIADGSTVVGSKTFQVETGIQLEYRRTEDQDEHTLSLPKSL